jgi:hypothetical protein
MRSAFSFAVLSVSCLGFASVSAPAQQVVHALTGTVSAIDNAAKTITVFQDNGDQGTFGELPSSKLHIEFDKKVEAGTTPAAAFDKKGAYAIVFYVGESDARTVVALRSLGAGPFSSTVGTVEKFESRSITVQDKSGATHTFKIDAQTVAEGGMGVEEGTKFRADRGDQVRIVSSTVEGTPTALFLRQM